MPTKLDKPIVIPNTLSISKSFARPVTRTKISRGGLDEINPDDIIYGEYSSDSTHGEYIDFIYQDSDILRTFSGSIISPHPLLEELKITLLDDRKFYLIPIVEVEAGFAFKRNDITNIKVIPVALGGKDYPPACVWELEFDHKGTKTIETNYQSYFTYGNTTRPNSMKNKHILDKTFRDIE